MVDLFDYNHKFIVGAYVVFIVDDVFVTYTFNGG